MYNVNDRVQIMNHAEPQCNGQYGVIKSIQPGYDGYTMFYMVELDDTLQYCTCIEDELMEE